jgi:hypothetical protein
VADGREIIEETYKTITGISDGLGELRKSYPEEAFVEFEGAIGSCIKWAKLCRNKVWLRTGEGIGRAQGCLDAAGRLQANLGNPDIANEAAADLSSQLEGLARVISTKAQVIT